MFSATAAGKATPAADACNHIDVQAAVMILVLPVL
jgi:hypothetical protein